MAEPSGCRARMRALAGKVAREARVYRLVLKDPRTPWLSRVLLFLGLTYPVMPYNLIPNWIPVIGLLDDAVIVPLLIWLALRKIPPEVVVECRRRVAEKDKL